MNKVDIIIVGNGVLGISAAYALSLEEPTLKIAVVGPHQRAGSGSLAAGAMLNCFGEINKTTLETKYSQAKFEIARQASKLWPTWLDRINSTLPPQERVYITPGTFVLLNAKAGKRENQNFSTILQSARRFQEPCEEVDPSEIPGLFAADDSRPLRALYLANEGYIDFCRLLSAIERIIVQTGKVILVDASVEQLLLKKERVVGVATQSGEILEANTVLIAAGCYSQSLLEKIPSLKNRIPRILAGTGCSLILKADKHQFNSVIRTPNRAGSCGMHMLPYGCNRDLLYVGASNNVCLFPQSYPRGRDVYYLLERAMEQFNQNLHKAEIIKWQIGNRPVPFDTFPLIGPTSIMGLWVLTGNYRDGLHGSPFLATLLTREILGKTPLFSHPFHPERFPIEIMTKRESILEFSDQYISAGYEHNMKLPKLSWNLEIEEMISNRIEGLYQALEIDIGLSPDLLFMFHQRKEMIPFFKKYYQAIKQEFRSYEENQRKAYV